MFRTGLVDWIVSRLLDFMVIIEIIAITIARTLGLSEGNESCVVNLSGGLANNSFLLRFTYNYTIFYSVPRIPTHLLLNLLFHLKNVIH